LAMELKAKLFEPLNDVLVPKTCKGAHQLATING
jgi:hypothetical protein